MVASAMPETDEFHRLVPPFRQPPAAPQAIDMAKLHDILNLQNARSILTALSYDKLLTDLTKASNMRQRAIILTGLEKGARYAVALTPKDAEKTVLSEKSFRRLAKYASGVPLFPLRRGAAAGCCFCGDVIDVWGDHTATCKLSGLTTPRHDDLRDANEAQLLRAGFDVHKEPRGLVQGVADRPADVLVRRFGRSEDTWIDHTIVGPFSPSRVGASSEKLGAATAFKEKEKRGLAEEACTALGAVFVPFAASTVGGLGIDALTVLRRIAAKVADQCRSSFGQELGFLIRELVVAIHRGNNLMWEQQEFSLHPLPGESKKTCRRGQARPRRAARAF